MFQRYIGPISLVFALALMGFVSAKTADPLSNRMPYAFLEDGMPSGQISPTVGGSRWDGTMGHRQIRSAGSIVRILRLELPNHSEAELHELARLVLKLSDRYKFSPILVLSLIKVESGFDRLAVSHQGAMGLMQIKPSTAMEVASRIRVPLEADHELYQPAVNMVLSLHYLKELREQFREPHLYLAAYNVGPGAVQKFIKSDSPVPANYYLKVRRSYNQYARVLLSQGT